MASDEKAVIRSWPSIKETGAELACVAGRVVPLVARSMRG